MATPVINQNDRLKSQATFLSNLAIAMVATGVLTPIAGAALGTSPDLAEKASVALLVLVFLVCSAYIYWMSSKILDNLAEDS